MYKSQWRYTQVTPVKEEEIIICKSHIENRTWYDIMASVSLVHAHCIDILDRVAGNI